jgi:predicted dehydrogenase
MQTEGKLKIGIIGAGNIAKVHAQAIEASSNSVLHSVYSRTEKKAKNLAGKHQIKGYTDWDAFISDPELDAVSICSPSGNHLDYGEKAAKAGKHVIVEKPIEVTLERAAQLIKVCKENDVSLAVIYQSRWIQSIKELKKSLENQGLGKVFMGDAYIKWYRGQDYYDSAAWRGTLELDGGGVLINQAIHTIDLLQWFMGDVESISGKIATLTHERLEGEDNAVAIVKFRSGALGVIEGSTSIQPAQPRRIELHGEKGTIILDGDDVKILGSEKADDGKENEKGEASGAASPFSGFSYEPHKLQFEAIAQAILRGKQPPVSGEESMKSLAIVLAVYESSKTNRPVYMDEFLK